MRSSLEKTAYYGANLLKLFAQDLRDRFGNQRARANARWGFVNPPPGTGKLLWVRAGRSEHSVRLAVNLLAAIRAKRLDLRLVLTFEESYPGIYLPILEELKKTAYGFGVCDYPRALKRFMKRMNPFAVVVVGDDPGANFWRIINDQSSLHSVAFQCAAPPVPVEAFYPSADFGNTHHGTADAAHIAPATEMITLLTPAQVEPSFLSALTGGRDLPLFWVHGANDGNAQKLVSAWTSSAFHERAFLCLSADGVFPGPALEKACIREGYAALRISQWNRLSLNPNNIILLDEKKWLPAVAASVTASYHISFSRDIFWQTLAGGKPLIVESQLAARIQLVENVAISKAEDFAHALQQWQTLKNEPFLARQTGDRGRQLFWSTRRIAQDGLNELLQKVYDW